MKHTPGPWASAPYGSDIQVCGLNGGGILALVRRIWHPEMAEDDARLIAAAPDLYEALRALFALVEDGTLIRDISRDMEPGWAAKQLPLVMTLKRAHVALEKARGER